MATKKKKTMMTTPKGIAAWPWLNTPDTRWDDVGVYSVTLLLEREEASILLEESLKPFFKVGYEAVLHEQGKKSLKTASLPWSDEEDDEGNATGKVKFKFKNKSSYVHDGEKVENRVVLLDTQKSVIQSRVGGGSVIRVGFEPYVWYVPSMGVGMTLRVRAVQVIELVEYNGSGGADAFDFEVEAGFAAEAPASKPKPESNDFGIDF